MRLGARDSVRVLCLCTHIYVRACLCECMHVCDEYVCAISANEIQLFKCAQNYKTILSILYFVHRKIIQLYV